MKTISSRKAILTVCLLATISFCVQQALAENNKNNFPVKPALAITEVSADFSNGELVIQGLNFDNGTEPIVLMGNFLSPLSLISSDAEEIRAYLPDPLPDGDYRLVVYTGSGTINYDAYDLTVGAVGPQGEQGKIGPQGEQGKIGPQGPQGVPGISGYELVTRTIDVPDLIMGSRTEWFSLSCPGTKKVFGGGVSYLTTLVPDGQAPGEIPVAYRNGPINSQTWEVLFRCLVIDPCTATQFELAIICADAQ